MVKNMSYVTTAPSSQNIINLFQGEWLSNIPNLVTAPGGLGLFDDERIKWAESILGSFDQKEILELGPFEGGHSSMLSYRDAHVTAIEANPKAFLKCLCVKEILNLKNVQFLLGDFVKYLEIATYPFDIVLASGVLYHMENPLGLLRLISLRANKLYLWTHYYDEHVIESNPSLSKKFGKAEYFGHYTAYRHDYQDVLDSNTFCGGPLSHSYWMTRDSILQALGQLGFNKIDISFDTPNHPNGPAFAVCARKI